jgi:uncharacterized protein YndB with AHSA1/START domain
MPPSTPDPAARFEQSLLVDAPPSRVFDCFFDPNALRAWWQTARSVTTPVTLGVFAIQWQTTPYRDDLLGPLGGTFFGTIIDINPGREFQVADAYWVPPEGAPLGPMTLHVQCLAEGSGCRLHVRQEGEDMSPRWRRYYVVVSRGWQLSLMALKRYAESAERAPAESPAAPRGN